MVFDVEIVLRERDYAVTERVAAPDRQPRDWTEEDVEQVLQLPTADGGEEAVHDLLLLGGADRDTRSSRGDVVTGAMRDLAHRGR